MSIGITWFVTCNDSNAIGATKLQIIIQDILPGIINQIIVIFTLEVGVAILAEASLSFLGVGIQPPTPSWGLLIAEGKEAIFFQPWLIILPGIALFLLVVSINMLGDGLRDITDPNSKIEIKSKVEVPISNLKQNINSKKFNTKYFTSIINRKKII